MSDLIGGGPMSAASNGRGGNGNGRPQFTPPVTTSSPSGVRGPRDIMRDRLARQERRELQEKENLERARAEDEARLAEEERRRSAERRVTAAGAAGPQRGSGETGPRVSGGTAGQRISDNSVRSERRSGDRITSDPNQPLQGIGRGGTAVGGGNTGSARPRPTQSSQQARPEQGESSRPRPTPQLLSQPDLQDTAQTGYQANPRPDASAGPIPGFSSAEQTQHDSTAATRSSFPHAFERWETLSAHWEGLTSFWIRRLEENSREIARDPLSSQLSRQVTDLSAAGANLFHAVVELQRLRASSERKFQRWFFETRAEQERFQEIQALCTNSLGDERTLRIAAEAKVTLLEERLEKEHGGADKQLAEMRRELQISKEEARRAWEELGRREQEERERTASLRDGQPTLVGGVQVVPMMQGVPSRHGSTRDVPPTREGPVVSQPPIEEEPEIDDSDIAYQAYSRSQRDPLDPFLEPPSTNAPRAQSANSSRLADYTQAPAVQPTSASSSAFYQHQQGATLHPSERDPRSETGFSEEEEYEIDARGDFIRDDKGNKVRYRAPASDADTDEYDVSTEREREIANLQRYGQTTRPEYAEQISGGAGSSSVPAISEPEYTGQGYGSGPGWEAVPRHHHPTRLSDVLEEDERSRTSASQVSRRE